MSTESLLRIVDARCPTHGHCPSIACQTAIVKWCPGHTPSWFRRKTLRCPDCLQPLLITVEDALDRHDAAVGR